MDTIGGDELASRTPHRHPRPEKPLVIFASTAPRRSTIPATPLGGAKAAFANNSSSRARGIPMSSAIAVLRNTVAVGAIALAAVVSVGVPLASGAPGCDGRCNVTPATGGTDSTGGSSNKGGGSHGAQPTIPSVKLPPPAIINAQTVVQTAPPPPPPVRIPPPVIDVQQPLIPDTPVEPQRPAVVPVEVVPPAPVVAPVPVEIPLPAPPSAPPAPVVTPISRVLFTSSTEPMGIQSLTIIVLFMVCGCWVYGNRIASRMSERRNERATAGA